MGRMQIDRIDAAQARPLFLDRFYAAERPVIIEGVNIPGSLRARLGSRNILDDIIRREAGRDVKPRSTGWLDMTDEVLLKQHADAAFHDFISSLIPRTGVSFRHTWVRVFGHKQGHITSWHYDGNGIHNLNLCVHGRKHWQLVSPETPLVHFPFGVGAFQGYMPLTERQRERLDWMEFECREGEMLFVPRGWSHFVIALEPWNANVTWVFTPREAPGSTRVGRREMASVLALDWLRRPGVYRLLPRWMKTHVDIETGDDEFASRAASLRGKADIGPLAADIAGEVGRIPLALAAHLLYQVLPETKPRER